MSGTCAPIPRKTQISTNKPLQELKDVTKERNEFAGLQTSWAAYAAEHLDPSIMQGARKEVTNREHVSLELYGALKDQARREAELEYEERMKAVRSREYKLEDAQRWFDVGRVLEENALKKTAGEDPRAGGGGQSHLREARSLLSRVEALATVTSSEFVKAFRTFRSLTRRLLQKVGWVDENYVSGKLPPSGADSVGTCIPGRRFTNSELLCLRLALEPETST